MENKGDGILSKSRTLQVALLAGVCVAAYAWVLDNHFIADDYVFIEYGERLKSDFFFLFDLPPLNFRLTTFAVLGLLQSLAGYRSEVFYAFSIAIHFVNCLLLWRLLRLLGRDASEAHLAAVFFAVFHAPNEAVMWITPMQEPLLGICVLSILIFWIRERVGLGLLVYCLALFTKEAAPLVLLLLPLLQWYRGQPLFPRRYFLFLLPTAGFAVLFYWTWINNSMIQQSFYSFGIGALGVLGLTIHRLIWPWLYIFIVVRRFGGGSWIGPGAIGSGLILLAAPMLPYIFLTYQKALPSRHLYLACMVFAGAMAYVIRRAPNALLRRAAICVFIAFNIGYLVLRKDGQFEDRAAPTRQLLEILRSRPPSQILLFNFPYPNPHVAKAVSRLVPGWTPELVGVDVAGDACSGCLKLKWDPLSRMYHEVTDALPAEAPR